MWVGNPRKFNASARLRRAIDGEGVMPAKDVEGIFSRASYEHLSQAFQKREEEKGRRKLDVKEERKEFCIFYGLFNKI